MADIIIVGRGAGILLLMFGLAYLLVYLPQKWSGLFG